MSGYEGGFDYSSTGMDGGNMGFGGNGGFMPSQSDARPSPSSKKTNRERQSLIPVTIRQLKSVPVQADDPIKIDGVEVSQVKLVGAILNVTEQSTYITYDIVDGTGNIQVKSWVTSSDNEHVAQLRAACRPGVYVRLVAYAQVFNDTIQLNAVRMTPIEDFNEITYHNLEAIYIHLLHTKGAPSAPAPQAGWNQGGYNPGFQPHSAPSTNLGNSMGAESSGGTFTPIQQQVLTAFEQLGNGEQGAPLEQVIQHLGPSGIPEDEIRHAVRFLTDEAHLYSTIDDFHFKSTAQQ